MSKTIISEGDEGVQLIVKNPKPAEASTAEPRSPVHVVYGGAHLYRSDTPQKLGKLALASLKEYAPNFVEFAHAMTLPGTEGLPRIPKAVANLEAQIAKDPEKARESEFAAWFAWTVYKRTTEKLRREPVEDFRIDFEDGYGSRADEEEDRYADLASTELAASFAGRTALPFCGLRVKSFAPETAERAKRTLEIFLDNLIRATGGKLPQGFAVTLPKVTSRKQIKEICKILARHEKKAGISDGSIGVEIMIETPDAIFDKKGRVPLRGFIKAAGKRSVSAHFGAYDYTSALSIAAPFQDIRHSACDFARHMMQASLSPLGVRLSDSVTTELPVPLHRGNDLSGAQLTENRRSVHAGWRRHFENITRSMSAGFYQSWDLHPNQLPARYAAVYSFYLYNYAAQARRLRGFIEKASQASMAGATFDDAASAQGVLTFFRRALGCGALTADEVETATGLSASRIASLSFSEFV
ncbi:MAG TPA: hypothetical protein VK468_04025 [Pyrinomonadaceae bacterium]|nr:hypothetical protein [Pyrinomonadaceae bacterium]